ncbi:hypothetical protein BBP40_011434, partial [Aspergillus hancockii]
MSIQTPTSAATFYLDQPPSCLQSCPASPNHFIIGTYLLTETKDASETSIQQTKTGSLQLWRLTPETNTLSRLEEVPLPYAVFDLHFHPRDPSLLAIATSTASVALFRVSSGPTPEIAHLWTKPVHEDPSIPALFLAWTPKDWLNEAPHADGFAVTFSDGRTSVFGAPNAVVSEQDGDRITELGTFAAGEMIEVWFVALGTVRASGGPVVPYLFTGDDFGGLRTRRFDRDPEVEGLLGPLVLDHDDRARHHTAGVTAILPLEGTVGDDGGAPV